MRLLRRWGTWGDLLLQWKVRNVLLAELVPHPFLRYVKGCRTCGRTLVTRASQLAGRCVVCREPR